MPALPTGTVTFLFSDVEGSTQLLQRLGPAYADALAAHHRIVREALAAHGGTEVDTAGDGFFVAFERATDAVAAAAAIQRALSAHAWPAGEAVRVRMGLHTGEPVITAAGYTGLDVHRAARIMGAAHGGQVLLSDSTRRLVAGALPEGVALRDLGAHALKDFDAPEPLAQLVVAGLLADFPPPRTRVARPTNLPRPPTPLIGRDAEVEALLALFRDGVRLATLTGPGGTGKTRLAVEVATRLLDDPDSGSGLEGGAWFVPLAPVTDPALVPQTVADALGAKEHRGTTAVEALAERVGARPTLAVLDNFEQVLDAAPFVSAWLMACPGLRVLVTSRSALRLQGEREVPVPPLPLPDARSTGAAHAGDAMSQFAAVRLFIERACAVRPDFRVDNRNAPAVAEICARLDGLPLAIELAAARVRLFSPEAMLARLARDGGPEAGTRSALDLLRGGARDLPGRHQTLRDTIRWSYDLLMPEEQRLFRRLAVFVGGCTLEAAAAVAGDAHPDPEEGVLTLLDHSLLRRDEGGGREAAGEPRFRMLETIREFGLDALDAAGEAEAAREAHARFFLALAREAEPHLTGLDQARWLDRLDAEQANLRAALAHLEGGDDLEAALQLGKALGRFWIVRGHLGEGYRRLGQLVARSEGGAPTSAWVAVRNTAGIMASEAGDMETALRLFDEVICACRDRCDTCGLATALSHLGYTYIQLGEPEKARPLCEEALRLQRQVGDLRGEAVALQNLGVLGTLEGRFAEAEALLLEGREKRRQHGEQRGFSFCHHWLASNSLWWGRPREALRYAEEGLRHLGDLGDAQVEAALYMDVGHAALDLEQLGEAVAALQRALPLWEQSGNPSGVAFTELGWGLALATRGEPEAGRALTARAMANLRRTSWQWVVAFGLVMDAEVLLALGDLDGAEAHFSEARAFNARIGFPRGTADSLLGLGAAAYAAGRPDEARAAFAEAARCYAEHGIALPPRLATRYGATLAAAGVAIPTSER